MRGDATTSPGPWTSWTARSGAIPTASNNGLESCPDQPVAVYCAYGFHVGCNVTRVLRARGLDARYVRGGLSAWYAAGGARAMRPPERDV